MIITPSGSNLAINISASTIASDSESHDIYIGHTHGQSLSVGGTCDKLTLKSNQYLTSLTLSTLNVNKIVLNEYMLSGVYTYLNKAYTYNKISYSAIESIFLDSITSS